MRVTVKDANQLCITTRCRSVEQFVSMFERYVDGNSIFITTIGSRAAGYETPFVILLADGTPVLRGRGIVRKAWGTGENPFRLPGLLLGLRTLTPRSKQVFEQLQRIRKATRRADQTMVSAIPPPPVPPPEPITMATTRRYVVPVPRAASSAEELDAFSTPTKQMPRPDLASTGVSLALAPRDLVLPANPLAALSDSALAGFIDCTMYESSGAWHASPRVRRRLRWVAAAAFVAATFAVLLAGLM